MNARDSLLDNFSSMHEEFNSSNNRIVRSVNDLFSDELKDLEDSLNYFNGEYLVVDKRKLKNILEELSKKLIETEGAHMMACKRNFDKEVEGLKQSMCNFFEQKLVKGEQNKKKICVGVKKVFDKMCDFNFIAFEEELDTVIYNFKVDFEMKYIHDEYCKDDFNKIVRSFEHELFEKLRSKSASFVMDKQEIFSRHVMKGYEIIENYRNNKR